MRSDWSLSYHEPYKNSMEVSCSPKHICHVAYITPRKIFIVNALISQRLVTIHFRFNRGVELIVTTQIGVLSIIKGKFRHDNAVVLCHFSE